ncbi:SWIM zinc finger family protein [Cellulomonas sp. P5_C5]
MPVRWTADQVLATAPDAASVAAGRKLAAPGPWSDTGVSTDPPALWGSCAGSGKTPYQTVVDLTGPAFKCSCPSRKFPCKHALGLLLLWSAGHVPEQEGPGDAAAAWLAARDDRATKAATRAEATPDPAAAARRSAARASRVGSGVEELDRWLRDEVRTGLAGADRGGYGRFDAVAARLVDAQAPGLAGSVRRLASVAASGEGWAGRLVEEYALLHLLTVGHHRIDELPPALADTVRARVGYPVRGEDVVSTPGLRDRWDVVGLRDGSDGRLTTRRVHLRGATTGRNAFVLSFAAGSQPLDSSLLPGTSVDADLHLYPGSFPVRAAVGTRHDDPAPASRDGGVPLGDLAGTWAAALADDPWLTELPVVLSGVRAVPGAPWVLVDDDGAAVPVRRGDRPWQLLALSGGRPATVSAVLTPAGLEPGGISTDDGWVTW